MKIHYDEPEMEIVYFEAEEEINSSGDYNGVDFLDLI
jgi:hypothetical protein